MIHSDARQLAYPRGGLNVVDGEEEEEEEGEEGEEEAWFLFLRCSRAGKMSARAASGRRTRSLDPVPLRY